MSYDQLQAQNDPENNGFVPGQAPPQAAPVYNGYQMPYQPAPVGSNLPQYVVHHHGGNGGNDDGRNDDDTSSIPEKHLNVSCIVVHCLYVVHPLSLSSISVLSLSLSLSPSHSYSWSLMLVLRNTRAQKPFHRSTMPMDLYSNTRNSFFTMCLSYFLAFH